MRFIIPVILAKVAESTVTLPINNGAFIFPDMVDTNNDGIGDWRGQMGFIGGDMFSTAFSAYNGVGTCALSAVFGNTIRMFLASQNQGACPLPSGTTAVPSARYVLKSLDGNGKLVITKSGELTRMRLLVTV